MNKSSQEHNPRPQEHKLRNLLNFNDLAIYTTIHDLAIYKYKPVHSDSIQMDV